MGAIEMNLSGNCKSLIEKVTAEIDAQGIKPLDRVIHRKVENPRPINKPSDLAPLIEHTLLKPQATRGDIITLCNEAKQYHFRGVCVNPVFVEVARQQLAETGYLVAGVVGFPLGANLTAMKVEETRLVIELGASEVDMVVGLGALKGGDYKRVYEDIHAVVEAAGQIPVKVIIEAGLLEESEKIAACLLAMRARASFVKTSTGFLFVKTATGFEAKGAKLEDIRLMREVVGDKLGIKAAGGIQDFVMARDIVMAGATRIGCSASVAIVKES